MVIKNGKILCGRRRDNGLICGPGGHIKDGETDEEAAVRESREEFSIYPKRIVKIGDVEAVNGCLPAAIFLCVNFEGTPECDEKEMEDAKWLSLQELKKEKLFPAFEESLRILVMTLTGAIDSDIISETDGGEGSGNFGHEGRPGKIGGSGGGGSATGSNKLKVRGFKNKQHLNNHWKNGRTHQAEYAKDGITTAEQYAERAVSLAEMPVGGNIKGYKTKEGYICRYDVEKNDYVKADLEKGIRTMFKPDGGEAYFNDRKKVEGAEEDE